MMNSIAALKDLTDEEVEAFIRECFEQNYERLQAEGGHSLTPFVKDGALRQVMNYWKKLREIATKVTDTEVRLTLPDQVTPKERNYTIEGVVDIVCEDEHTVMYDLKTHDPDMIRENIEDYQDQLNVYAFIWRGLRGQPLHETAVISTAFPATLREAYRLRDRKRIAEEFEKWQPVIPVPLTDDRVEETIRDFGAVVDDIEDKCFTPPPVEKLKSKITERDRFATRVCRNCDARFSCSSYRNYFISSRSKGDFNFSEYFAETDESDAERLERIAMTLEAQPIPVE